MLPAGVKVSTDPEKRRKRASKSRLAANRFARKSSYHYHSVECITDRITLRVLSQFFTRLACQL